MHHSTTQRPLAFGAALVAGGGAAMSPEARHIAHLMGVTDDEYLEHRARQAAAALDVAADGTAHLLPAGEFRARDGRPGGGMLWRLSEFDGQALAAAVNACAARTPILVDYDHSTLTTHGTGNAAPAAGWIRRVQWLAGKGMVAAVSWTERAKELIRAKEYRYMSPVIEWDPASGRITGMPMASLCNHPALLGMDAVRAPLSGMAGRHAVTFVSPAARLAALW